MGKDDDKACAISSITFIIIKQARDHEKVTQMRQNL